MEKINQAMGGKNIELKTAASVSHEEKMVIIHEAYDVIKEAAQKRFVGINDTLGEVKRILLEKTSSNGNKLREQDVNSVVFLELEKIKDSLESFLSNLEVRG